MLGCIGLDRCIYEAVWAIEYCKPHPRFALLACLLLLLFLLDWMRREVVLPVALLGSSWLQTRNNLLQIEAGLRDSLRTDDIRIPTCRRVWRLAYLIAVERHPAQLFVTLQDLHSIVARLLGLERFGALSLFVGR
jgi:hypothetical protein